MVRATFSILSYPLALRFSSVIAILSKSCSFLPNGQNLRICLWLIEALHRMALSVNLFLWIERALSTRSFIWREVSQGAVLTKSVYLAAGTSMWMSILSNKGPDILER